MILVFTQNLKQLINFQLNFKLNNNILRKFLLYLKV